MSPFNSRAVRGSGRAGRSDAVRAVLTSLLLVAACESTPSDPGANTLDVQLLVVSGNNQIGPVNEELPEPLVVRAVDENGRPLNHLVVSFVPTMGGGIPWAGAANTNPQGYAREYWTLGPEPGDNRMEARLVDPITGEKLTLGTFVATAFEVVEPSAEVCDGVDNDQDGATDEDLAYCFGGQPAQNTDGAVCAEGFIDLNADATDGCETVDLIDGGYRLDAPIILSCPASPMGTMSVGNLAVTRTGVSTVSVLIPVTWSEIGEIYTPAVEVVFDESNLRFSGSGSYSAAVSTSLYDVSASGTYAFDMAQTAAGVLEGTMSLSASISGSAFGVIFDITCTAVENRSVRATLQ